jgi:hypothetical protein
MVRRISLIGSEISKRISPRIKAELKPLSLKIRMMRIP